MPSTASPWRGLHCPRPWPRVSRPHERSPGCRALAVTQETVDVPSRRSPRPRPRAHTSPSFGAGYGGKGGFSDLHPPLRVREIDEGLSLTLACAFGLARVEAQRHSLRYDAFRVVWPAGPASKSAAAPRARLAGRGTNGPRGAAVIARTLELRELQAVFAVEITMTRFVRRDQPPRALSLMSAARAHARVAGS
jgi:hypothetical protein